MSKKKSAVRSNVNAVNRVRKHFPQVNKVIDATDSVAVQVIKADVTGARRKDPARCALARACVRDKHVDGAIINIGYSYLVKGDTAVRYKTSVSVGREIVSFDRHSDFDEGKGYLLSKVCPSSRLGVKVSGSSGKRTGENASHSIVHKSHRTTRIRVQRQDK